MTLACREVKVRLPSLDDREQLPFRLATHAGTCLSCQAEIVRYRRLRRSLGLLAERVETAPQHFAAGVEARIAEPTTDQVASPARVARVAAAAGAVVAAAGTVAVVRWVRARSAA